MSKIKENLLFDMFQNLPERDKKSALDFVEYLSNRQMTHQSEQISEREYISKKISSFLDTLPLENLRILIWHLRGMELGMISQESNQEKRDMLSQKSIQESLEINQKLKSFLSVEKKGQSS